MSVKSPSGSTFPYYYKGGELHALKYGGLAGDIVSLAAVMDAEEAFIRSRPAQRLRIWVDLAETDMAVDAAKLLAEHMKRLEHQLVRLAVVGCGWSARRRVAAAMTKAQCTSVPFRFFADPEEAKTWLVAGGGA